MYAGISTWRNQRTFFLVVKSRAIICSIGLVSIFILPATYAKDTSSEHQETSTHFTHSATRPLTENQRAQLWNLDLKEWNDYQRIMQGPRGLWTPDLDPIHVLGMSAKTTSEMKKYARKMAQMEFDRLEREGNFSRAFELEINKLLNGRKLFPVNTQAVNDQDVVKQNLSFLGSRIQFFVQLPCDKCLQQIQTWLKGDATFDIHFLNAKNADIKLWVVKMGISPLLVSSKRITLNHINATGAKVLGVTVFPSWRRK